MRFYSLLKLFFFLILLGGSSLAQTLFATANATRGLTSCAPIYEQPARAFPSVDIGCGARLAYLGTYYSDGKYRADSLVSRIEETSEAAELNQEPRLRPTDVPEWVDLHGRERVVQNYAPTTHAVKRFKGHSIIAEWRDDLLTLAYGREKALLAPQFVTTDGTGRAIVSDPAAGAVHVLDDARPFRIASGKDSRLQSVGAVAVDAEDNIYVADPEGGVVEVFDPDGRFLREIGKFSSGEGLFHEPKAIAVDRNNRRLYVLDASRDTLFLLDLDGKVLKRAGGRRNESGIAFQQPVAIAVKQDEVVVLDGAGARIEVFDLQLELLRSFATGWMVDHAIDAALDLDSEGNIYLSNMEAANIRVYDPLGRSRGVFGTTGSRRGEFLSPAAVWIDETDRLFVSEKLSRRVQVFQITTEQQSASAKSPNGMQ